MTNNNIPVEEVVGYLEKIPTPDVYNNLTHEDAIKHIFNAQEEIKDVLIKYNGIDLTNRMVALQTLYNLEGEEEGIAMMRRQGITDYSVKDIKAVLNRDALSPNVLAIIDAFNQPPESNKMRVGRLI